MNAPRVRDLLRSVRHEGIAQAIRRTALARHRTRRIQTHTLDGLTPWAPLGWSGNAKAIWHHYELGFSGAAQRSEEQTRRDLARMQLISRNSRIRPIADVTVAVRASRDLRRTLACLESLLTWPGSRPWRLVILGMDDASERSRLTQSIPNAIAPPAEDGLNALLSGRGSPVEDQSLVTLAIDANDLVLPGWVDALVTQCRRPGVGLVTSRVVGFSWIDGDRRVGVDPVRSQPGQTISADAWAVRTALLDWADCEWRTLPDDGRLRRLGRRLQDAGFSNRTASDAIVVATSRPRGWVRRRSRPGSEAVDSTRSIPRTATHRPRLLIGTWDMPCIGQDSGSQDHYWLARHSLDLGADVTIAVINGALIDEYAWEFRVLGADVISCSGTSGQEALRRTALTADRLIAVDAYAARALLRARAGSSRHIPFAFCPADLTYFTREALHATAWLSDMELGPAEKTAVESADVVGVISEVELSYLRERRLGREPFLFPKRLGKPFRSAVQNPIAPTVVFVGNFKHPPNIGAATWLVTEIWPRVRAVVRGACLELYGSSLPPALKDSWGEVEGLTVVGRYEREEEPYKRASVAVAPLLSGGGVKGKVVTALGHGTPVVGTSIAAEGLPNDVVECMLVADDADGLASSLCEMLTDPQLRAQVSRRSMAAYDHHYSEEAGRQAVCELLERLAAVAGPS